MFDMAKFDSTHEVSNEEANAEKAKSNFFQPPGQFMHALGATDFMAPRELSRKKWLQYGEYAGGFQNFDRKTEIDIEDEIDAKIKDLKSNGEYERNRGDGFGHIGKGSKDMDIPLVKFHKESG